jgi:acetyl esterase/lipase
VVASEIEANAKQHWVGLLLSGAVVVAAVIAIALFLCNYTPGAICNLKYGENNSKGGNSLDLYLPEGVKKPYPLVVYIHGGGWVGGDKRLPPCRNLVQKGFAVASINYRLASEAQFPAQLEDCNNAIAWLGNHAEQFGLDKSRIGVWGTSAGGQLALLLSTADNGKNVKAVCDWCGPSNLFSFAEQTKGVYSSSNVDDKNPLIRLLGGLPKEKEDITRQASAVFHIHKNDAPLLIMHGDNDQVVPVSQSKELKDALDKAGARSELVIVKGAGHNFFNEDTEAKVLQFFVENLR